MSTGFHVNAPGINAAAHQVLRAMNALADIERYLAKSDVAGAFGGAFLQPLEGRADEALGKLKEELTNGASVAFHTADGLFACSRYYTSVDAQEAARQDGLLPGAKVPEVQLPEPGTGTALYSDTAHPGEFLKEPESYEDKMQWKATLESDIGSFTGAARELSRVVLDHDPFEALQDAISGDWREIRRIADRCSNASKAADAVAANLSWCSSSLSADWQGNAGEQARSYLLSLHEGVYTEVRRAQFLAEKMKELAEGAFGAFNAVTGLISQCIDAFIEAVAAGVVAGGGATVPGPGWIVAGGAGLYAGWKVGRAIDLGIEAYKKYNEIKYLVETAKSAMDMLNGGDFAGQNEKLKEMPKPYEPPF